MKLLPSRFPVTTLREALRRSLLALALATPVYPQTPATGTLAGRVVNAETGHFLEGAAVAVARTTLATSTTRTGEFEITGVPAGRQELTISYTGLDTRTLAVDLPAGGRVERSIELTSGVYRLEPFQVTGIREGHAAAITAQRIAPNIANIIAMDAYGNIADGNIGNFIQRLPGVDQNKSNGDIQGFGVRGMPQALSTVTMDGGMLAAATFTKFNFNMARNDYRFSGVNRIADYSRVSRAAIEAGTVPRTSTNQTASLARAFDLLEAGLRRLAAPTPTAPSGNRTVKTNMLVVMARPQRLSRVERAAPRQRLRKNQVPQRFEAPTDCPETGFPIHERLESMGFPAETPNPVAKKTRKKPKKASSRVLRALRELRV